MKRVGDIVIACLLLAITAPLLLVLAIAVKWESPGPSFEREPCVGAGGRRFQMLKFRTSVRDPDDPRPERARGMTNVGSFLRYTRLEHLPQLFNVLRGEMGILDPTRRSPSF